MPEPMRSEGPPDPGRPPDARFLLANERTFLAWTRTALALVAAGLAIAHLLPTLGNSALNLAFGLAVMALGALIAFASYKNWRENERALKERAELPRSALPRLLAMTVGISAIAAAVLTALAAARR